ncbi:hypothetical protein [Nocardia sp. NPDC050710]|uniref:hypothetical protein n=1 Tax=Nocardia sp. NPDC050710 TaxID=3157220 RepID=UPI0033EE53C0
MSTEPDSVAITAAIAAARAVADPGPRHAGLVIVMYRGSRVVAVLHRSVDQIDLATAAITAEGADAAVLIVVGSARVIGPVLARLPRVTEQLRQAQVRVAAAVQCRTLADGCALVDLSDNNPRDGIVARSQTRQPPPHRPRISGLLGLARIRGGGRERDGSGDGNG